MVNRACFYSRDLDLPKERFQKSMRFRMDSRSHICEARRIKCWGTANHRAKAESGRAGQGGERAGGRDGFCLHSTDTRAWLSERRAAALLRRERARTNTHRRGSLLLFTGDVQTKILKIAQQTAPPPLFQAGFSMGGEFFNSENTLDFRLHIPGQQ